MLSNYFFIKLAQSMNERLVNDALSNSYSKISNSTKLLGNSAVNAVKVLNASPSPSSSLVKSFKNVATSAVKRF